MLLNFYVLLTFVFIFHYINAVSIHIRHNRSITFIKHYPRVKTSRFYSNDESKSSKRATGTSAEDDDEILVSGIPEDGSFYPDGDEDDYTLEGEQPSPVADLREAEGEVNRRAPCNGKDGPRVEADGRTPSGVEWKETTSDVTVEGEQEYYDDDDNDYKISTISESQYTSEENFQSTPPSQGLPPDIVEPFGDAWKKYISDEPSYSLTEYGEVLPEGCKTFMDFSGYPRNYDFAGASKLALDFTDGIIEDAKLELSNQAKLDQLQRKKDGDVYTGPYPKSAYESILGIDMIDKNRIYSTLDQGDLDILPENMYDKISNLKLPHNVNNNKGKNIDENGGIYPDNNGVDCEENNGVNKDIINNLYEDSFIFDEYGYIKHYLLNLNRYNYKIHSYHQRDNKKVSYYLNHEYIDYIYKDFPPKPDHTLFIRKYLINILPNVMDELVDLIKDDPNRFNTPSPPLHDLSLIQNFYIPRYFNENLNEEENEDDYGDQSGENYNDENGDENEENGEYYAVMGENNKYTMKDYIKYSDLIGLHEPDKGLIYPYANIEPLRQRELLKIFIDMINTNELGPLSKYRKYISHTKLQRLKSFPNHTKYSKELDREYFNQLFNDENNDLYDDKLNQWYEGTISTGPEHIKNIHHIYNLHLRLQPLLVLQTALPITYL